MFKMSFSYALIETCHPQQPMGEGEFRSFDIAFSSKERFTQKFKFSNYLLKFKCFMDYETFMQLSISMGVGYF